MTEPEQHADLHPAAVQRRLRKLFTEGFTALDLADPLQSFDADRPGRDVLAAMQRRGEVLAGVRRDGRVVAWVAEEDLGDEPCSTAARPILAEQRCPFDTSLRDVVGILDDHGTCFVSLLGDVVGVITREDVDKPPMRMWLFGMITIIEAYITRLLAEEYPDGLWRELLSAGRLAKAEELLAERQRRGRRVDLLDCLQFADKTQLVMRNPGWREDAGYGSRREADEAIRKLQALRNDLAHSQEIAEANWEAIVILARRLERITSRV